MHKEIALALNPRYLGLILFPTEKCNFRCTYCYESYDKGRMAPDIVERIKKLIAHRSSTIDCLNLCWFGGEPLLTKDVIYDLLGFASRQAQTHSFQLFSSMTTNGSLLDEESFLRLGALNVVDYQISLDGAREYHNKKRFIHRPDGSFDMIWNNILLFNRLRREDRLKTGKILLRLHVHEDNADSLLDLARQIDAHLDERFFRVMFKNIAHLGGQNDQSFGVIDPQSVESARRRVLLGEILHRFAAVEPENIKNHSLCYAAKPNNFAIRSDGALAKCTVALEDERNHIGRLTEDGTFQFYPERLAPWIDALKTLDPEILNCPLSFVTRSAENLPATA